MCKKLANINAPKAKSVYIRAFQYCNALTSVVFPSAKDVWDYSLNSCSSLEVVDLPSATTIANSAFAQSTKFNTLILRSNTVCSLSSAAAFNFTPFYTTGKSGTVYVPQALITEYQNATNWSKLYANGTCNFVAIEGSEYE
jgi:hypothetical protein